jgi:hypothetical protein
MAFGYETSSWWAGGCVQSASNPKKTSKRTAASRRRGDVDETLTPLPVAPLRSSTTTDLLSRNILPLFRRTLAPDTLATDMTFYVSGTSSSKPVFFVFSRPPMKELQCLPTYGENTSTTFFLNGILHDPPDCIPPPIIAEHDGCVSRCADELCAGCPLRKRNPAKHQHRRCRHGRR